MNDIAATSSFTARETTHRFPVFVFWVGLQVIALLVWRFDLQLSANPAHSAGRWPTEILLITQICASALLLRDLLATVRQSLLAFALAFPLTQLAAIGEGWASGLRCSAILLLWLIGLTGWRAAMPDCRALVALASLWTLGSAIVWYLIAEFALRPSCSQTIASLSPLHQAAHTALPLFVIHAVVGLVAFVASIRLRRHGKN